MKGKNKTLLKNQGHYLIYHVFMNSEQWEKFNFRVKDLYKGSALFCPIASKSTL